MPSATTAENTDTFTTFMLRLLDSEGRDRYEQDIPAHAMAAIDLYLCHGILPGDAMACVLRNDLVGAVLRADAQIRPAIPAIVSYLHEVVPDLAWGSPERVAEWPEYRLTWKRRNDARCGR